MSSEWFNLWVFVLSCIIGYHVIWGVTPALHTPLMAVTNAVSAIVVVGAIFLAGYSNEGDSHQLFSLSLTWIEIIGFFAVFLAAINIFGGFVVTSRMLAMFKKK